MFSVAYVSFTHRWILRLILFFLLHHNQILNIRTLDNVNINTYTWMLLFIIMYDYYIGVKTSTTCINHIWGTAGSSDHSSLGSSRGPDVAWRKLSKAKYYIYKIETEMIWSVEIQLQEFVEMFRLSNTWIISNPHLCFSFLKESVGNCLEDQETYHFGLNVVT